MFFDRFDIVEAHYAFCCDYHGGQDSALYARLCRILNPDRIGFRPAPSFNGFESLEDNGKLIYNALQIRHGFTPTETFRWGRS